MIRLLQEWEDELRVAERDATFQERVIAATLAHDPKLEMAQAMFGDRSVEQREEGNVFFPTSAEEFQRMAEMFSQEG